MKILVIASEPVNAELIGRSSDAGAGDDVRVLAPTLPDSGLRYWLNDTDDAIERAQQIVDESVAALAEGDVSVEGDAPTDDDPAVSVADAIHQFQPDRVLVVKHRERNEAYREGSVLDEARSQTDVPVLVKEIGAPR
jgi:hypothetical protein